MLLQIELEITLYVEVIFFMPTELRTQKLFIVSTGTRELVEDLLQDDMLTSQPAARQGLGEMRDLLMYCDAFEILDKVTCMAVWGGKISILSTNIISLFMRAGGV